VLARVMLAAVRNKQIKRKERKKNYSSMYLENIHENSVSIINPLD